MTPLPHKPARLHLVLGVLVSCVGCDQVTKKIAVEKLQHAEGMSFLGDVVRIQYAENPGAFLGLFSNLPEPARFYLVTVSNALLLIALAAGVLMASRNVNKATLLAMTLVLGGGLGNLIDRVARNGRVTDFLNVGIGPFRTGIFNLADVCIMLGALLFFYVSMRRERMPDV